MNNNYENQELNQSLQDVGANLVKSELEKKNPYTEIRIVDAKFSVLSTKINDRKALIFLKTVMFPMDYETTIDEFIPEIRHDILQNLDAESLKEYDVYAMGLGAVQKYVESDEDKGTFRIGGKYAGAFGMLKLIKKAESGNLGYSVDNPLPADGVAGEYAMLKDVMADHGIVIRKNRKCSIKGSNGHLLDKWVLDVADFDGIFQYRYEIYMDAYSKDKENCLMKLDSEATFGEWKMPENFRSVWFSED